MKEKDFYEVVSAIAQFIEKADKEPDFSKNDLPEYQKTWGINKIREDEAKNGSSK